MQLRHDNPFGTVDDKRTTFGHQRDFAQIDILFADVLDHLGASRCITIVNDQTHFHAQRCAIAQTANLAFANIESRFAEVVIHVRNFSIT